MMLGGAIGNIIDRVTQGFVTDFIAVGRFPVFNVADSAVTVGGWSDAFSHLFAGKKQKSDPEEAEGKRCRVNLFDWCMRERTIPPSG